MPNDNSSRFPKPLAADLQELSEGMAIVINGDTAPKAIASGQYLFIKNHSTLATGGYHATAAIASGADITSSNVTADADGIVNGAFSSLSEQITNHAMSVELFSGSKGDQDIGSISEAYTNFEYLLVYFGIYAYDNQPVLIRTSDITLNQTACTASFLGNSDGYHGQTTCNVYAWISIKFTSTTTFTIGEGHTNQYVPAFVKKIIGIGRKAS